MGVPLKFRWWSLRNWGKGYRFDPVQRFRCCDHDRPLRVRCDHLRSGLVMGGATDDEPTAVDAYNQVITEGIPQQPSLALFHSARLQSQVLRARNRCTGISSDALALYGSNGAPEPRPFDYPSDLDDLRACERTYLLAPDNVRERMLPTLEKYREYVTARRIKYRTR